MTEKTMTIFMKQETTGHITHDFSITKGIGRKRNTQIHLLRLGDFLLCYTGHTLPPILFS